MHRVKFTALLGAELASLTAALDKPGTDIGAGLRRLAASAAAAVSSYLGLSVFITRDESPFTVALLEDGVTAGDIGTSIVLVLPGIDDGVVTVAFILYARAPGAFVDLAADMAWLTGHPLTDFALDEHLTPPDTATPLVQESAINQAIGVLIGRGYTTQQAQWELDTQAAHRRTDRLTIARLILARLPPSGDDHFDVH
jgi:hypothetical protein